jgi:cholesterol transport system auxiliary component
MSRTRKSGFLAPIVFGIAVSLLLTGCIRLLQQPPVPRTAYSFSVDSARKSHSSLAPILAVRLFDSSPMFENQEFVYRLGATRWETDFYNAFAQPPAVLLTFETRRWMQNSGLFRAVAIPGLAPADSWQLQGFLTELYGDFQDAAAPQAVLAMRFTLLPPGAQASTKPLFNKSYDERVPLKEKSPSGLVDAWNRGAELILAELVNDIREAQATYQREPLPPPPPTPTPGLLEALGL